MNKKKINPPLAFDDAEFMQRDVCRPIRLNMEFMRPDEIMQDLHIDSTVVIFGSARILPIEDVKEQLAELKASGRDPECSEYKSELAELKRQKGIAKYYTSAMRFAELVSESNNRNEHCATVVTGGGPGIMEAGNRGAHDAGVNSVALNIKLPYEQYPNEYVTEKLCFNFRYFSIRKMHFLLRAKALACFPGGFGTMDELFEVLTLVQTQKIERMPIVLFGENFWKKLVNWEFFVEQGMINRKDLDLIYFPKTPQDAWDYIVDFWKKNPSK